MYYDDVRSRSSDNMCTRMCEAGIRTRKRWGIVALYCGLLFSLFGVLFDVERKHEGNMLIE